MFLLNMSEHHLQRKVSNTAFKSGSLGKYIQNAQNCYFPLTTKHWSTNGKRRYCNNSPSFLHREIKAVFSQWIFTHQDLHVHKQKENKIWLSGRSHDHSHLSHPPPHVRFSPVTSSLALLTTPSREPVHTARQTDRQAGRHQDKVYQLTSICHLQ